MAAILGISGLYHDAAAALVVDGRIVAALSQERLSRIKNDASLPFSAARACLDLGGIAPQELHAVVFYEDPFSKLERVMVGLLRNVPRSWRQFPRAMAAQLGSKIWVLDALAEGLGVPRSRVQLREHHRCHAASAYYASPWDDAAVLVVDGVGEHSSTTLWHGRGRELEPVAAIDFPHSLGLLYAGLTGYLGFEVNEGEYKVMGLAAWGRPCLRDAFDRIVKLHADGSYELSLACFGHMSDAELGFAPALEQLLGPRRPAGTSWDLASPQDQRYADIAATLQAVTEEAMLALARRTLAITGARHLCLAGGVALNAVANARLATELACSGIFVQPAAGDAGGALGAALLGALDHGDPRPSPMQTAALGVPIDAARAWAVASSLGLDPTRCSDPAMELARRIAAGEIVALATGRCEWGPRALGQRSLLADPRASAMRERMNRVIKQREPFRPFAPAVLAEHTSAWFDVQPDAMTPFMTRTAAVHSSARERLPAVTHVDGTARLQSVTREAAERLHDVLACLQRSTDVPVVLNTSLNGPGEPIVASAEDALAFFLRHGIDAMMIEDVLVERSR